jgi:hypothetical protein
MARMYTQNVDKTERTWWLVEQEKDNSSQYIHLPRYAVNEKEGLWEGMYLILPFSYPSYHFGKSFMDLDFVRRSRASAFSFIRREIVALSLLVVSVLPLLVKADMLP